MASDACPLGRYWLFKVRVAGCYGVIENFRQGVIDFEKSSGCHRQGVISVI